MSASATGGPDLPQERRLVTEIPGPTSRALHERRTTAVARGVGSVLPVTSPGPAVAWSSTSTATR